MSDSSFCPKCGAENPIDAERCGSCNAGISGQALVDDEQQEKMRFQQETFQWKWVFIGLLVIGGAHALIVFVLFRFVFIDNVWLQMGIGAAPYLLGGALIGALSPGKTFLEPFYASVLPAIAFPMTVEMQRVLAMGLPDIGRTMAEVSWLNALAPILVYVILALFGSWVGEKIQGTV